MVYGVFRIRPESAFLLFAFSTLLSCSIATFACMQPGRSLPAIICVLVLPVLAYWLSIVGCRQKGFAVSDEEGKPEGLAKVEEGDVPSGILGPSPARKIPKRAFLFPLMQMLCYSITFSFALFIGLNGGQESVSSGFIWLGAMLSGVFILGPSRFLVGSTDLQLREGQLPELQVYHGLEVLRVPEAARQPLG